MVAMNLTRLLLFSFALVTLTGACNGTTSAPAPPPVSSSCDDIASACHRADTGQGLASECHDLGHAGDERVCAERRTACLTECAASTPDAGAADATATTDAGAPGDPRCTELCACLEKTCASYPGYPFAAGGSCAATCATLGEAERACFPKWCAKARVTPSKHSCEHAWGALGLDECDAL